MRISIARIALALLLSACASAPACPGSGEGPRLEVPAQPMRAARVELEISGRKVLVDRLVEGPLCNDAWSGTVYVGCDVEVPPWEDKDHPTFFEDCDLVIAPGTVVYVADHNNAAYYNGCSCHTGEILAP